MIIEPTSIIPPAAKRLPVPEDKTITQYHWFTLNGARHPVQWRADVMTWVARPLEFDKMEYLGPAGNPPLNTIDNVVRSETRHYLTPLNPDVSGWHWVQRYWGCTVMLYWDSSMHEAGLSGWGSLHEPFRENTWRYFGPAYLEEQQSFRHVKPYIKILADVIRELERYR